MEVGDESSTDSFRWDGDDDGADFKPDGSVSMYPLPTVGQSLPSPISSSPSCSWVSLESDPSSLSDTDPSPDDIILPPGLVSALHRAISPEAFVEGLRLVVADTGATDHMVPDRSAFISYKAIRNLRVRMGNNSFAPVLGRGTAIISLNGQRILIRHVLHVPALRVPLYSLRAHLRQRGCGFCGQPRHGHACLLSGLGSQCGHIYRLSPDL